MLGGGGEEKYRESYRKCRTTYRDKHMYIYIEDKYKKIQTIVLNTIKLSKLSI